MIDHVSVGVADLERSRRFYDAALRPLGLARTVDSDVASDYGFAPGAIGVEFTITSCAAGTAPSMGSHLCFRAPSREAVEAFHREALANGGSDDGAAGLRPQYHADYFAAFVLDPDGHRIEAVHHAPQAGARTGAQAVEAFYRELGAGRLDAALALLARDASWNDPKGFPYGGRLSGAAEVKERVFARIGADWATFAVNVERIVPSADGSSVLAVGRYTGRHGKTARTLDAPFAHVWSTSRGELTRFETFTDTAAIHEAMAVSTEP